MELSFHGQTQLVCRSGMLNGEALALPVWLERPWHPYRSATMLVEADRLSNPQCAPDTELLRGNMERDRYGAPLAYWIRRTHPGDLMAGWLTSGAGAWDSIPARTDWGRPVSCTSTPRSAASQPWQVGEESARGWPPTQRETPHPWEPSPLGDSSASTCGFAAKPDYRALGPFGDEYGNIGRRPQPLAGHAQERRRHSALPRGNEVAPFTPARPNPNQAGFVENCVHHLSVGTHLPYELVYKDFSKSNYSSARAALLEAWRTFTTRRAWLASSWAHPWYELWLEEDINADNTETPDFYQRRYACTRAKWIGVGRGGIDPVKEAQTAQLRMEIGISTLEDECAEQGED